MVVVVALSVVLGLYYLADPESRGMPRCAFRMITGYDCQGCGFQRALHAMLHGDVATAWSFNPFIFFAIPAALFYIVAEALRYRYPRLHARANHPLILMAILVAILAFWLARNLLR